jgi:hypothetical protein
MSPAYKQVRKQQTCFVRQLAFPTLYSLSCPGPLCVRYRLRKIPVVVAYDLAYTETPNNYLAGPRAILSGISDVDAKMNTRHNAYYVPEITMAIKRYQDLKDDLTAFGRFVEQQQNIASQMMKVSPWCVNFCAFLNACSWSTR